MKNFAGFFSRKTTLKREKLDERKNLGYNKIVKL